MPKLQVESHYRNFFSDTLNVTYRNVQAYLKPYPLHCKYSEIELNSCDMQTVKSDPKQVNHKQTIPKRNIEPQ